MRIDAGIMGMYVNEKTLKISPGNQRSNTRLRYYYLCGFPLLSGCVKLCFLGFLFLFACLSNSVWILFFAFDFDFAHVSKFPCLSLVPVFVASHFYLPVFLFPEAGEMAANGKASGVYSNCCTGSKRSFNFSNQIEH